MVRAYLKGYLEDVLNNLGYVFDVAVNFYHYDIDEFANLFKNSAVARGIEEKFPLYLVGQSSLELLGTILKRNDIPRMFFPPEKSREFWVGFVYAYANWYLIKPFSELIDLVPASKLREYYNPYHETSDTKIMELFLRPSDYHSVIKTLRERIDLSQTDLAKISGISVRTIRFYEKDKASLLRANGETIYKLSDALGVSMEYLIKHSIT